MTTTKADAERDALMTELLDNLAAASQALTAGVNTLLKIEGRGLEGNFDTSSFTTDLSSMVDGLNDAFRRTESER